MQAFANLEPFGPLQEDFRAGQICAVLANVNRDPKARREPFSPRDFMPALARALQGLDKPSDGLLLDDPEAQAALIKAAIFGVTEN